MFGIIVGAFLATIALSIVCIILLWRYPFLRIGCIYIISSPTSMALQYHWDMDGWANGVSLSGTEQSCFLYFFERPFLEKSVRGDGIEEGRIWNQKRL